MASKNAPVRVLADGTKCYTKDCKRHTAGMLPQASRAGLVQWIMTGDMPVSMREVVRFHYPRATEQVSDIMVEGLFSAMSDDEITLAYLAVKATNDQARTGRKKKVSR